MATTTLKKWGNGTGLYVPLDAIKSLGLHVGQEAICTVDIATSTITYDFAPQKYYRRHKKITMDDLLANWDGNKVGNDETITGSVGHEVIV